MRDTIFLALAICLIVAICGLLFWWRANDGIPPPPPDNVLFLHEESGLWCWYTRENALTIVRELHCERR